MSPRNRPESAASIDASPEVAADTSPPPTGPLAANLGDGANGLSILQTHSLLEALLEDEYGDEGWNDTGSLRRIARFVNSHFAAILREHVERALAEVEQRINERIADLPEGREEWARGAIAALRGVRRDIGDIPAAREEQS